MKAPLDNAATEPDGLVRIPPTTDERAIGALLEGLDEPQPLVPARLSGSNLLPRAQLETALLPDVDRRQRRRGAIIGLALGLTVTLIAGTVAVRTVFLTRNADAAGTLVPPPASTSTTTSPVVAAPAGTWTSPPSPLAAAPPVTPPTAAVTDLPVVAAPPSPSASAAAPSTAKRPGHPASSSSSSSPREPRRGYGLTSDEP